MVGLLTWDRQGSLGESGGSLIGKGGQWDVKSQWCRLRTDGLAPTSKYWTYWSHAGNMGSVNRCSWLAIDAWLYPYCFNVCCGRETEYGPTDRLADVLWIGTESFFLRSSSSVQRCWWLCKMLPHMGTTHRKCTSGVHGLAREAYVSCVSGFPCRAYINSYHRDPQIWVTACLVAVST
jgi:hypothetical protein